jgi:hypothetical protein
MNTRPQGWIGYATLGLVITGLALVAIRSSGRDVKFCRTLFRQLVDGKPAAQQHIAWETFQAIGKNIGEEYQALQDGYQRTKYQVAFVENFAKGFRQSGAAFEDFKNWRMYARGDDATIVAADYPNTAGTLLFHVTRGRPTRLQRIQFIGAVATADAGRSSEVR